MKNAHAQRGVSIIDTNVLLHNSGCLEKFGTNIIILPIWVIEELDKFKKRQDELGANAREISRQIDQLRSHGSLKTGVPTATGGLLIVDYNGANFNKLPVGLAHTNDNRIILIALAWQEQKTEKRKKRAERKKIKLEYSYVEIVTKDINMRLKADACGIIARDYMGDKSIERIDQLYSGMTTHAVPEHAGNIFTDHAIYQHGFIPESMLASVVDLETINANQCCRFENVEGKSMETIYKKAVGHFRIIPKITPRERKGSGILPINREQQLAYELLKDPDIAVVTLNGKAGSGKTLMALLAGYNQVCEGLYEQLIVYRPNHEIGQPIGFLPGDIREKFAPFTLPIFDNIKLIVNQRKVAKKMRDIQPAKDEGCNEVNKLIADELLQISPINYIRGRSIPNAFVIIDEAQQLLPLEAKTMISRAGAGTKFVFTGDVHQIDNPLIDSISNGLSHTIERLKDSELFGHITLTKCERSPLSELAASLL